jgi:hypothetical protein
MIIKPKRENSRYNTPGDSFHRRRSVGLQNLGNSIISPRIEARSLNNQSRKISWRNESDYLNQVSKGIKINKKDAKNFDNLNYGERYNKNVFNDEYKRNLYAAQK